MARVEINPGICGLKTVIETVTDDQQQVKLVWQSQCADIRKLGETLQEVDAYEAALGKMFDSPVYKAASVHCRHAACPVPMATIKAIEVAAGLALPKDVEVKITKE